MTPLPTCRPLLQKDMPRIPEILKAIPQSDIDRMRANIARVWRRCAMLGCEMMIAVVDDAGV